MPGNSRDTDFGRRPSPLQLSQPEQARLLLLCLSSRQHHEIAVLLCNDIHVVETRMNTIGQSDGSKASRNLTIQEPNVLSRKPLIDRELAESRIMDTGMHVNTLYS